MSEQDAPYRLSAESEPDDSDVRYVQDQLHAYNIRTTGLLDYQPLAVFVRDRQGALVGGLTGFTWGGTLKIEYLWLPEDSRGRGYGTRLVAAAEREAKARGCQQAVLDTHSFQAPDFYPKLGYTTCGIADDWPIGYRQYYFQKRLQSDTPRLKPGACLQPNDGLRR
jgi:GNAT superfamily N-acetyltransferase